MATGTGKTVVAFQICWKLWSARWNRTGEYRRAKLLYLADRNILIDDPKDKIFAALPRSALGEKELIVCAKRRRPSWNAMDRRPGPSWTDSWKNTPNTEQPSSSSRMC